MASDDRSTWASIVSCTQDSDGYAAVVSFQPGNLDARKLSTALYQKDHIGCATRGGRKDDVAVVAHGSYHWGIASSTVAELLGLTTRKSVFFSEACRRA